MSEPISYARQRLEEMLRRERAEMVERGMLVEEVQAEIAAAWMRKHKRSKREKVDGNS